MITTTYDATLSRVRIAVTALVVGVDTVTFERSTNQIGWTTVRGGSAVPVLSSAASLDDYEFVPDVVNYYRATAVDTAAISYIGVGAAATGNNTSLVPALPAGWVAGDLGLILASIRNAGAGFPSTPSGWMSLVGTDNISLFVRRLEAGDVAPTITFSGGVAGADTIAQCAVFRNVDSVAAGLPVVQNNSSAQNIAYPALTVSVNNQLIIAAGWKQDDWTSVAGAFGTEIAETPVTAGNDAGQVWNYSIQTTATNIGASSWTVTGGGAAISRAMVTALQVAPWRTRETDSVSPTLDAVWIKSIVRPFLNTAVDIRSYSEIKRPGRSGIFEVVGRSAPVAVTDVRGSRRFTIELRCETPDEADDLELVLASGDPLFIQVPTTVDLISTTPGGYVVVGDITRWALAPHLPITIIELPCTVVAAPGPDVVGATVTWQSVLNAYGTWDAVVDAHDDWASLLELIGDPGDVIVS